MQQRRTALQVLIIDDDRKQQGLARKTIGAALGDPQRTLDLLRVQFSRSAADGLKLVRVAPVDLVILDLRLGGDGDILENGLDFLSGFAEVVPLVILKTQAALSQREEARIRALQKGWPNIAVAQGDGDDPGTWCRALALALLKHVRGLSARRLRQVFQRVPCIINDAAANVHRRAATRINRSYLRRNVSQQEQRELLRDLYDSGSELYRAVGQTPLGSLPYFVAPFDFRRGIVPWELMLLQSDMWLPIVRTVDAPAPGPRAGEPIRRLLLVHGKGVGHRSEFQAIVDALPRLPGTPVQVEVPRARRDDELGSSEWIPWEGEPVALDSGRLRVGEFTVDILPLREFADGLTMSRVDVLHFAMHGVLDQPDPRVQQEILAAIDTCGPRLIVFNACNSSYLVTPSEETYPMRLDPLQALFGDDSATEAVVATQYLLVEEGTATWSRVFYGVLLIHGFAGLAAGWARAAVAREYGQLWELANVVIARAHTGFLCLPPESAARA